MFELMDRIFERWKIITIHYENKAKIHESYRTVGFMGFMTYKGALRAVRRKELEDTMTGDYCTEYVIFRNKV